MKTSESFLANNKAGLMSVSLLTVCIQSLLGGGGEGFKAHQVLKVIKALYEKGIFLLIVAAVGLDTRNGFRPSNVFKNINLIILGENTH